MTIDLKKIMKTKFQSRTKDVSLPNMAEYSDDNEAIWTVRGLTGSELARVNEAGDTAKNISAVAAGLAGGADAGLTEAIKELIGATENVPQDLVRRIEMLIHGSVEPEIDRQTAVKLADAFTVDFYTLTNTILELTGKGKVSEKPHGSGGTRKSEPQQPSATKKGVSSSK